MTHNEQLVEALLEYLESGRMTHVNDEGVDTYRALARCLSEGGGVTNFYFLLGRINQVRQRIGVEDCS